MFLKPILPGSRHLRQDVIEADADGYPRLERSLVVIDCDLPEDVLRDQLPGLLVLPPGGPAAGHPLRLPGQPPLALVCPGAAGPAPFLCTYMGRQGANGNPFRFFWNHSRAIAANVYLMLYPRGPLKRRWTGRPTWAGSCSRCSRRSPADHLMGEGRVYGGGLHKLEPKELRASPPMRSPRS